MTDVDTWFYELRYGDTIADHDWAPIYFHRFLASSFLAHTMAEDRRADAFTGVVLWFEALKQDPAGTLPDDDVQLARLAGFGADLARWRAAREWALYGWVPVVIDDDARAHRTARLGHPVVARIAIDMARRKSGRKQSRDAAREAQLRLKIKTKLRAKGQKRLADNPEAVERLVQWFAQNGLYVTDENVGAGLELLGVPRLVVGGSSEVQ